MERESFEDETVAQLLNEHFVSIKVDREERPDVDSIYMSFCQAMTGSGGWPLTIFMTAEQKPFFAGTYFPKESHWGGWGFLKLLEEIHELWITDPEKLLSSGDELVEQVTRSVTQDHSASLSSRMPKMAFQDYLYSFDKKHGGFGRKPKFPSPQNLYYLLRYWRITGDHQALTMVEKTLLAIYQGGIFDHIGFGFSRYATDEKWLVPHFEKMLYDNALLSIAYVEAYQATGKPFYKEVAEAVFHYVLRDMTDSEGGFYAAEDADSEGEEGLFYLWEPHQLREILSEEEAARFCKAYDITSAGNFEGKNIPNLLHHDLVAWIEDREERQRLNESREKLFEAREKRIHPHKDDKQLTAWNGMMIAALAYGARALDESIYLDAAERAAQFILNRLRNEKGRLLARYRDGHAGFLAYLDDYAYFVWGLLELYQTTLHTNYLQEAVQLNQEMISLFWDHQQGGFFLYGRDAEKLLFRPKEAYDGATPSGNSVAAYNLFRLAKLTGDHDLQAMARKTIEVFAKQVKRSPSSFGFLLSGLLYDQNSGMEIVIAGSREDERTQAMLQVFNKSFQPFTTVFLNDETPLAHGLNPFAKEQKAIESLSTAYVCRAQACQPPVTQAAELEALIRNPYLSNQK